MISVGNSNHQQNTHNNCAATGAITRAEAAVEPEVRPAGATSTSRMLTINCAATDVIARAKALVGFRSGR